MASGECACGVALRIMQHFEVRRRASFQRGPVLRCCTKYLIAGTIVFHHGILAKQSISVMKMVRYDETRTQRRQKVLISEVPIS